MKDMNWKKVSLKSLVVGAACLITFVCIWGSKLMAHAQTEEIMTIVLDPGHGGDAGGAERDSDGIKEKDVNYKIAQHLKKYLEHYEGVRVVLTRDGDYDLSLEERSKIAANEEADLMVSLHNNAAGPICAYRNGCTVLASKRQYKPEIGQEEQELSVCILQELSKLGIENQGILLRDSQSGDKYENGQIADYYGLIRSGVNLEIPTIIVEHAFLDSDEDYEKYLSTDKKLDLLARADARGIARYYGLVSKKTGKTLEKPSPVEEKQVLIIDEDCKHNTVTYELFFEDNKDQDGLTEKEKKEIEKIIKDMFEIWKNELMEVAS